MNTFNVEQIEILAKDTHASQGLSSERVWPNWTPKQLGVLLLSGTIALGSALYKSSAEAFASSQSAAAGNVPIQLTTNPEKLSGQANNLVSSTAEAWANHQTDDGNFFDPVYGRGGGYGVPMIGQALIETGVAANNETFLQDGVKAEAYDVAHPTNGGFEKLGLASAYSWNQANLAANPDWQAATADVASFLKTLGKPAVSSGAETCYNDPRCWTNLKLVGAFDNIKLMSDGLADSQGPPLGRTATLHNQVGKLLAQAARNTGADAYYAGNAMRFKGAGILSDPSRDPLAYHDLSTMILGHVIDSLGLANTPSAVRAAFQRSARAMVGFMAPDGDGAYIGRGQGQVWNVAAEADALSLAAHYTADPVWRGRYLAGAARALNRLETDYTPGAWGLPLVPRLANNSEPSYLGIDGYANSVEYNGLSLWALQDAVSQLRRTSPAPTEGIGSDADGVFVDPSHTKFAAIRKGNLWWAIHAGDTAPDARYDFGLVAGERLTNGAWEPAIPYRPFTEVKASGGPVLVSHGQHLVPVGREIIATAVGVVDVKGGWAERPGGQPAIRNVKWTFKPEDNGVNMSFHSPGSYTYEFQSWYEKGSDVTATARGLSVNEPNGRHESYTFNKPVTITNGPIDHSAYDENLSSSTMTIHTKPGHEKVSYTTTF